MKYIAVSDELYHHGIKGMKWGVRRERRKKVKALRKTTRLQNYYERKVSHLIDQYQRLEKQGKYDPVVAMQLSDKYNQYLWMKKLRQQKIDDLNEFDIRTGRKVVNEVLST